MAEANRDRIEPDPAQEASVAGNPLLEKTVDEISALEPISAACTHLLQLIGDRRSSVDDLAASIDPGMTAGLLRLANSAHYGHARQVTTLHDALLIIGFGPVQAAALSGCVANSFNQRDSRFDTEAFWFFSVTIAQLTQLIAVANHRHVNEAFTAGILHGLGRLALAQYYPDELETAKLLAAGGGFSLSQAQLEVFGFTDAELGSALAARWDFPTDLVEVIAQHQLDNTIPMSNVSLADDVARARKYALAYGLTDGVQVRER
ncbi:MAG: HDOD domain-containing protein, partial [Dehalococcoidia bacterium]|nr:HDOD domain-containing protein [Dehalococcoidia bacterium]